MSRRRAFLMLAPVWIALLWLWACASSPSLSQERKDTIRGYWTMYLKEDPSWPECRQKWLALGEEESRILVNWLIKEVQRNAVRTRLDAEGKPEPAWRRPVGELEQIGARSIPPLLEALRILRDETTVYPCILALAAIADSSRIEQELLAAGGGQEGIRFQARLVKVLGNIQDPAAVNRLMEVLSGTYDWQVRATAAEVLGAYRGALEGQVRVCLETARKDKDLFVASKAEKALKSLNP